MLERKRFFVLAGVFLAIAVIAPGAIFMYNSSLNSDNQVIVNNPNGKVTSGNITLAQGYPEKQGINNIIPVIIAIIFFLLFAATMYFAIRRIEQ